MKNYTTKELNKAIENLRHLPPALPLLVFRKLYGRDETLSIFNSSKKDDVSFIRLISSYIADDFPEISDQFSALLDEMYSFEYPYPHSKIEEIFSLSDSDIDYLILSPELMVQYKFAEDLGSKSIELLAKKILSEIKSDTILDLCSGQGMFLASCYVDGVASKLVGQEINYTTYSESVLRLKALGADISNISHGDVLKNPFWEESGENLPKFDRIYSDFPWGLRAGFYEYFLENYLNKNSFDDYSVHKVRELDEQNFKILKRMFAAEEGKFTSTTTLDWFFIMQMVLLLSLNGKAIGIIPDGITYRHIDKKYREQLINGKMVEAVIKLPSALKPNTKMTSVVLVLSHNNETVTMVDASNFGKAERGKTILNDDDIEQIFNLYKSNHDSEIAISVDAQTMSSYDFSFDPDKYLYDITDEISYPVKLKAATLDIYRGAQFSTKGSLEDNFTGYSLLTIKDIEDGIVNKNLSHLNEDIGQQYSSFSLKDNDVVITARGNNIKSGIYKFSKRTKVVPSGNLLIIRADTKKLNPHYLTLFLNSKTGQQLLKSIHTGGVIFSINKSQLENLTISLPPLEIQNSIANTFLLKQADLIVAKNKVANLESELQNLYEALMEEEI